MVNGKVRFHGRSIVITRPDKLCHFFCTYLFSPSCLTHFTLSWTLRHGLLHFYRQSLFCISLSFRKANQQAYMLNDHSQVVTTQSPVTTAIMVFSVCEDITVLSPGMPCSESPVKCHGTAVPVPSHSQLHGFLITQYQRPAPGSEIICCLASARKRDSDEEIDNLSRQ